MTAKTLLKLAFDGAAVFDGSVTGVSVVNAERASVQGGALRLQRGGVEFARNPEADALQAFTVTASVTPGQIGPEGRSILDGESPPVSLSIDAGGRVVGSVHTAAGWARVTSGATTLRANVTAHIRFWRDDVGDLGLEIDGQAVGNTRATGALVSAGSRGLVLGAGADGIRTPFVGKIADLEVQKGAVTAQWLAQKQAAAAQILSTFKQKTGLARVVVNLLPDASHARLQRVKDIMNAVGVQRLSDLDVLRVTTRTAMTRGKVMVAPRKAAAAPTNWSAAAATFAAQPARRQIMLAALLANRNSARLLEQAQPAAQPGSPPGAGPAGVTPGGRVVGTGTASTTGLRLPVEVLRASPALRLASEAIPIAERISLGPQAIRLLESDVIARLKEATPASWPVTSDHAVQLHALNTIPVDSAVIIAGTLDLTETQLIVEPNVETLYVIAERVICGSNAGITWRKPGGTTPARANDPALDGRGWSGVQTKPNSRDGLDGEDGSPGVAGIDGPAGCRSPKLELWVKDLSAVPNIDLSGEDGIKGGTGQRGGRGGRGGDGHVGHRYWVFGWHCDTDPGDGGHGGNGGAGGRGGRGGTGSNGGKIAIGVLEGTLQSTVTNRAFRIKNQGGRKGQGGDGGAGGDGGSGGRSGAGETCKNAHNGAAGAKGQPGPAGGLGASDGFDGEIEFFEFTQAAWDDMLTRPWLASVTPVQAFPGDRLTLRGSRFSSADRVVMGALTVTPTMNADESISVTVPLTASGGLTAVYVRRQDGTDSNRVDIWVKPQLDQLPALAHGAQATLGGRAFLPGAAVVVNGAAIPANVTAPTQLSFAMPGTSGTGASGGEITVQVRNPDAMVSNSRTGVLPRILEVPFKFGKHNLGFGNFTDGVPDWGTYEETFGAAEVWHELLDPVFGHPILTTAFYGFYHYFLKGEANGGLATGFCTAMSALVADRFWQGLTDTPAIQKAQVHKMLTAVHGRLLSRESLIGFHDQGRQGNARVEQSARAIEATFLRGTDRDNQPLVFFIPAGEVWDSGYVDRLGSSHCVMPYRFAYPVGRAAPRLTPDGSSTTTDLDGVELFVWDCNHPTSETCKLRFRRSSGELRFDYFPDGATTPKFSSEQGITLGMMTNGEYYLADHDLPFGGPFGLTRFVIDFLLSPADLQITSATGLKTGNFGGQILAQIPDSHPCYLMPGAYLLPPSTALTRRIVGRSAGQYQFTSIMPEGVSITLENVATAPGHEDMLAISADGSQLRFTPAVEKAPTFTICRLVGNQARALSIQGMGGAPGADVDLTVAPDLSLIRVGNRGAARANVEVRAFVSEKVANLNVNQKVSGIAVPASHDLAVAVPDWTTLNMTADAIPFP